MVQTLAMLHHPFVIDTNRDMFEYMVQLFSKSKKKVLFEKEIILLIRYLQYPI
jgi:hypothetical protein